MDKSHRYKNFSLIGAALELGQSKSGTELAPSWLKLKGLKESLSRKCYKLTDLGELSSSAFSREETEYRESNAKNIASLNAYSHRLADLMADELRNDQFVFTIGGDHSCGIGTVAGALNYNPDIRIIWVDAHADINTPETSPSGNVHGMPLAFHLGLIKDQNVRELTKWVPQLKPENIAYIGLRDVDPGEVQILKDMGIRAYTAKDVKDQGVQNILAEVRSDLDPDNQQEFHISFDVDALDPKFIPSTGTPVMEGLDLIEGQAILREFALTGRLTSLDLAEVNPLLGEEKDLELTAASTFALIDGLPQWKDVEAPAQRPIWVSSEDISEMRSQ